jgi:hypothetical protein
MHLFLAGLVGHGIPNGQLRSEILKFDFDAFITAAIKSRYNNPIWSSYISRIFSIWMRTLTMAVRMVILNLPKGLINLITDLNL